MAFTRDHDEFIVKRMRKDSEFARRSFDKVMELIVDGEPETARVILRNLVNATIGFEELAKQTEKNREADPPAHSHEVGNAPSYGYESGDWAYRDRGGDASDVPQQRVRSVSTLIYTIARHE